MPPRPRSAAAVPVPDDLRFQVRGDLIRDEGLKPTLYRCTAGHLTIGVGYNLDAHGWERLESIIGRLLNRTAPTLTRDEAIKVCDVQIGEAYRDAKRLLPNFDALDLVRQRVVVNFVFNLGLRRALGFKRFIAAMKTGDYTLAALSLLQSLWATQVGDGPGKRYDRAERLADMVRTGQPPSR